VPPFALKIAAAAILFAFGLYRLFRSRHPNWVGMRVGFGDLTLWSFVMASAHGAGLMLIPLFLKSAPQTLAPHTGPMALHTHSTCGLGFVNFNTPSLLASSVAVHTLGYLFGNWRGSDVGLREVRCRNVAARLVQRRFVLDARVDGDWFIYPLPLIWSCRPRYISSFADCRRLGNAGGVEILTTVASARSLAKSKPRVLVPTMGALHEAHLQLIRIAREHAGRDGQVVVSIFVNPLQFEPGSDYQRYPRPEKADEDFCRDAGVDLLFRPPLGEMYFDDGSTFVEETSLSSVLEGKSRPGHFRGVCTVVAKLFNIVAPDAAVFGEKDFQQLAIVRRMVRDLNFEIEIIGVPTVREEDGLACSSRNQYLNLEERKQAAVLHKALVAAANAGKKSASDVVDLARKVINEAPLAQIDYVELVDAETLQPVETVGANSLLALAVFFGKTRLIDNIRLP